MTSFSQYSTWHMKCRSKLSADAITANVKIPSEGSFGLVCRLFCLRHIRSTGNFIVVVYLWSLALPLNQLHEHFKSVSKNPDSWVPKSCNFKCFKCVSSNNTTIFCTVKEHVSYVLFRNRLETQFTLHPFQGWFLTARLLVTNSRISGII